jgi:hypothetical protein
MPCRNRTIGTANNAGVKIVEFQSNNPVVNDRLSRSNLFHIQTVRSVFLHARQLYSYTTRLSHITLYNLRSPHQRLFGERRKKH